MSEPEVCAPTRHGVDGAWENPSWARTRGQPPSNVGALIVRSTNASFIRDLAPSWENDKRTLLNRFAVAGRPITASRPVLALPFADVEEALEWCQPR